MSQPIENSILVVIPTFNEAGNIVPLLRLIRDKVEGVDVLVVDDNSPDGTGALVTRFRAADPNVHLLSRPKKNGLAGAYIAGFQWALEHAYETVIEMDADFSHDPFDLPRLIEARKTSDAVVGCRYKDGGAISGWSWLRQGISRGGNVYAKSLLGLPYQDLTGGFNAWSREVLTAINIQSIRSRGYAFQVELKYRTHRAGFKIKEIPIHFKNRTEGESKMSGSIVFEAAWKVLQMRFSAV